MASYPFKKTNKNVYQKPSTVLTEDNIYWKKLGAPVLVKEFGAIDYIDFSPVEPYYFSVTCSVRVQVYNPITKVVARNLSRFRQAAYGGSFRSDGRLLVAGGEEAVVKLFDVQSKSLLRLFGGHTAAVHRTFFTKNQTGVVSFSDDKSTSLWDIASETRVQTFTEHTDYIRAGCVSPLSADIMLSGGYDSIIKMYDCRGDKSVLTLNHGSPVESIIFLPTGGIFVSAGGTEIKVWDVFAGGKLLANISQHHKTITCLCLASNNSRLLSSSLDRHVKIYDISTFQTVHDIDFPNAVLSVDISGNDETLAAGMVDGLVSIRRREENSKFADKKSTIKYKYSAGTVHASADETLDNRNPDKISKHDAFLKKFQYSRALDAVMLSYVSTKTPEVTVALLQELIRRNGLKSALAGRENKSLVTILKFLIKNIGINRFSRTLIDVVNSFIDVYEDKVNTFSDDVLAMYKILNDQVEEEVKLAKELIEVEGALNLLLTASSAASHNDATNYNNELIPSNTARENFIINVS